MKTERQIKIETNKVKKQLKDLRLSCCGIAWSIPTNDLKYQILKGELDDVEIEKEFNFVKEITEETDEDVILNCVLTRFFYINEIFNTGIVEEYEELTHDVVFEFLYN